jgi:hypothetical protein
MVEPNLTRSALPLFAGFHAAPRLALAAVVVVAWAIVALNDASSSLLSLLIAVLILTFAVQSGLGGLTPAF